MTAQYPQNQQPYGQPQQQPYGQSPGQQPYGQPGQGYPGQTPIYGSPYGQVNEAPRSNTLGIVGLALVVVSAIALIWVTWVLGQAYAVFVVDMINKGADADTIQNDPAFQGFVRSVTGQVSIASLATLVGIVGWIISIVAVAQKRGRTFGIWGIVLGILAPIIAFILFAMTIAQFAAGLN